MLDIEKRSEPISSVELLDLADYADGPLASHVRRRIIWNKLRDFGLEGSGSVG